jgi:alpha-2-macroglobulin
MVVRTYKLLYAVLLPFLLLSCVTDREKTKTVSPAAIYLLNHDHWTTALVLNFNTALAPFDDRGAALNEAVPRLEPALSGEWRWQDPSRLVFLPSKQTLPPDTLLRISLQNLKLRPGFRLAKPDLTYQTPPLQITHQECRWQDSPDAPLRRSLEFTAEFNYPVQHPPVSAVIGNGAKIAIQTNSGVRITATSEALLRPKEDSTLTATFTAGSITLLSRGNSSTKAVRSITAENNSLFRPRYNSSPTATVNADSVLFQPQDNSATHTTLAFGAQCTLPVLHSDWDTFDAAKKVIPTVTGIRISYASSAPDKEHVIGLSLVGKDLMESAKKARAGKQVQSGIVITPLVEGSWTYGEDKDGNDLNFTQSLPTSLKPGVSYQITIDQSVFPELTFTQPQFTETITLPQMSGSISDFRLHNDPREPKIKRAAATLNFSHPPQREILAAKTSVRSRQLPNKDFHLAIAYELTYDQKNPLVAYLKTEPLRIADDPSEIRLEIDAGVVADIGGEPCKYQAKSTLALPSARDYLNITSLEVQRILKEDDSYERLLMVRSNVALQDPSNLEKAVSAYILPDCHIENQERPALCAQKEVNEWQSADQIDEEVLGISIPVQVHWRDAGIEDKTIQHLTCVAPEKRQMFIKVAQGIESVDGFRLGKDARFLKELGADQRELKILHEGALLSLSGDKKLGVTVRGIDAVHIELQRILPHNIHHLASMSYSFSAFQKPNFTVPIEHFAEKFEYDEILAVDQERLNRQYFSVDFGRFVNAQGSMPRGLFILKVTEKNEDKAEETPRKTRRASNKSRKSSDVPPDQRLVLLTDMGLLVKTDTTDQQNVFVMSFRKGLPVSDARVSLLGRNGVALFSGNTDSKGRVVFPSTAGLKAEKTPTVYLAEKDGDLSFLPFNHDNRQLNLSRFDTDGLRDGPDSLHAYLFSDRGIYRPGDIVHVGMVLRKRDWSTLPVGLPLKAVITDPQGQEIWSRTVAFGAEGFEAIDWVSPAEGKTGGYRIELIVADTKKTLLGSTKIRVEEFQPDRLQVKSEILDAPKKGWLSPEEVTAMVTVRNLFGTPTEGNTTKLELTVRPWSGRIPEYDGYHFRRTAIDKIPDKPQPLGDVLTDSQGKAAFKLPLSAISEPIYEIAVVGEGFEKGSGRSVVATASTLVSRQDYILGYKTDGNMDYLPKGAERSLKLLAVGGNFQPRTNEMLSAEVYETRFVSTLVQRRDGLYQYQSVARQEPRTTKAIMLSDGAAEFVLPSDNPGSFFVVFKNKKGEELNRADYTVAGRGNVTRNIEHNAELQLNLNKKEYQPGETLELQIVAPYHGAGLITIEQDGVMFSQWFKSETTSSNHRIMLPQDISGNAYVSVAFVRSLDSREVYMSPLSYGVAPFAVSRQRHTEDFKLTVPEKVQPGHNLEVSYRAGEPVKMVLYAVDEGILQFARYDNPSPLDHFFRKRALQVRTHQILDMILPDFALVQKLSTPGGDGDNKLLAKYKNPFARKHKPPMAFWSGIVDVQPGEQHLTIPVPDYFNGRIRVLAVAVNARKVGTAISQSVTSQPYVLQPQQPLVAAPGDEFDMGLLVANTSGAPKPQSLLVSAIVDDKSLELLSENPRTIELADGQDTSVRFHARVKNQLGPIKIHYQVKSGEKIVSLDEEMSIRPAQPMLTTLQGGVLTIDEQSKGKTRSLDFQRDLHTEERRLDLAVSITPAGYLRGIVDYLKHYPYGCTEQIVSQAFPAAVLGANNELGLSEEDVARQLARAIHTLQTRQRHDGDFGYWTAADQGQPFYSMYVSHFLMESLEHGHKVPEAMLERALRFADNLIQSRQYNSSSHEAKAYALYLLARRGNNESARLRAFEDELETHRLTSKESASPVTRFFLGAAYKLHHLDADADRFFGEFQRQWQSTGLLPPEVRNNPEHLNLYLYLVGKHFPNLLDDKDPQFGRYLMELAQDLVKQRINSFRGSMALLGLGSMWTRFEQESQQSYTVLAGTPPAQLTLSGKTLQSAELTTTTRPLEIRGEGKWNLYYQLSERGYDRAPPKKAIAEKLTINRSLLNNKGEPIDKLGLQDKLHIRIALHPDRAMHDVAVVLLIPGGFEVDLGDDGLAKRQSLPIEGKPTWQPDHIDVQEDRLVMFGALDGYERYFEFRLIPLNAGKFQVPPVFAEGMYDTEIQYRGLSDVITVSN